MNPILPERLSPGAIIGVISVSAPEAASEPEWYQRGTEYLEKRGYLVRPSRSVQKRHGYMSAPENQLAHDLAEMFTDTEISAIICAGGGTNANRLLRHLDFDTIVENPKIFMGMSNPTVLLNAINARTGLVTFHGPVVVWNFGHPEGLNRYTEANLWPLLETPQEYAFKPQSSWRWLRPGYASGRLQGGNLISLQGLLGTPYEPKWDDTIFFWEDIAKTTDRLDLILTHFRDVGVFDRISGMIVGKLVSCEPPANGQTLYQMLEEVLEGYNFPVLIDIDIGHTDDKLTLPIGINAELNSEDNRFKLTGPTVT